MLPERAQCLDCRYALASVEARCCPECGRAFDPADRLTFSFGDDGLDWQERSLRGPKWLNRVGAAACVALVLTFSPPGGRHFAIAFWAGAVAVVIAASWFGWAWAAVGAAHAHRGLAEHIRPRWRRWIAVPLMLVLTYAIVTSGAPRRIRFATAKPAMERMAKTMLAMPPGSLPRFEITAGLVQIWRAEARDGIALFHLSSRLGYLEHPVLIYVPEARNRSVFLPKSKEYETFKAAGASGGRNTDERLGSSYGFPCSSRIFLMARSW